MIKTATSILKQLKVKVLFNLDMLNMIYFSGIFYGQITSKKCAV